MNPLNELKNIISAATPTGSGTVVGQSGDRVLVRTAQGIKPIATDRVCTLGSSLTMNSKGEVSGVLDTSDLIPSYKV